MNIVFAGHEIDLRRQELRRAGQIVHVEPQAYDLLLHLVRHRDRVVSKDELLDAIWNGRIVSDGALSSRINAARKAIGDRQALIKTIHRRGFRFVGAVREGTEEVPPVEEPTRPTPDEKAALAEPIASSRQPSIAVLPFANRSQEPDTDYFSYGLTEDVIRLLARNRWLDVLSRHSAIAFRGKDIDPREIGAALGIRYIVQGTVAKHGERVRITADLVSAAAAILCCCVTMSIPLAHIVAFCGDIGVGARAGAAMPSLQLGAGVFAQQIWGWIADRLGGLCTILFASMGMVVSMTAFLLTQYEIGLYSVSAVFGRFFAIWCGLKRPQEGELRSSFPAMR